MGVEASRPPTNTPIGSSEKPATKVANTAHAPCATVIAVSAASSGEITPGHIKTTSGTDAIASRNKTIIQADRAIVIAPIPDNVKLNASNAVEATAATSIETLGLELNCASVIRQTTKCNRDFCVPVPVLQGPPCTPGNEAVVATGSGTPRNVNQPSLIERKLSVIPKEESAPDEHPANDSLDSISSAIIPESFEASDSLSLGYVQPFANIQSNITQQCITTASIESSLSPRKNSIIIPDVASTNVISSVLKSATEYSIENTGRTYATTPIKTEGTEVPVAVTYADATNLAAQYPDLASQILVSPLRKRTARQEIALIPEHNLIEEGPPSKRRPRRPRRHRSKRSRDNQESQQQSRGSLRTPGPDASPSRHKDPSFTSGLADPKATFGFHSAHNSRQPDRLVGSAPPTPNPSVERAPSLQTNRHTAPVTPHERTRNYHRETGDANWGARAAEIQASTPLPARFATPERAPVQEQDGAMLLKSEELAGTPKATDLATTSIGRRSINADMLLTELFRKAIETSSPSATKFRYPEHSPLRKSHAEGPDPIKALIAETARPVNQAEKIIEGDSPRVKLPPPSTPSMKTSPNPTYRSPIVRMEEDQTIRQSYKPPGTRTQEDPSYMPPAARTEEDYTLRQSYLPPAARTEEDCALRQSYLPPAAQTTEDRTITQNYKPPHQRLNENNYNAIITQKPPIYQASSLNRHSNLCTPPSPRAIELLERSERIRHLERLLSRERDLPISITGLTVPSPKPAQALQPIGPWQASDERAFHERGAIKPGTSTNQSLDLVRVMQAMGLDISSRKDAVAALGNGKPSGRVKDNSSNGVRRQSDTMTMEDTIVRNDLARAVHSQGLRSPRGGGGYRSVSGEHAPVTQWT